MHHAAAAAVAAVAPRTSCAGQTIQEEPEEGEEEAGRSLGHQVLSATDTSFAFTRSDAAAEAGSPRGTTPDAAGQQQTSHTPGTTPHAAGPSTSTSSAMPAVGRDQTHAHAQAAFDATACSQPASLLFPGFPGPPSEAPAAGRPYTPSAAAPAAATNGHVSGTGIGAGTAGSGCRPQPSLGRTNTRSRGFVRVGVWVPGGGLEV